MNWLAVLAALAVVSVALGVGAAIAVKKNPKVLPKLLSLVLVILAVSLLISVTVLFPSDSLTGFDGLWNWLMAGGTAARRFVAMLLSV